MSNVPASLRLFDIHDPDRHAVGDFTTIHAASPEYAAREYIEDQEFWEMEYPCLEGKERRLKVREQGIFLWKTVCVSGEILRLNGEDERIYFSHILPETAEAAVTG